MSTRKTELLMAHLSADRLHSYLISTEGDAFVAFSPYEWNSDISSAMFQVLGDVEIVLRNAVDREMQKLNVTLGNQGDWLNELNVGIPRIWRERVAQAKDYLVSEGKALTHPNIMSQLNFGFWRTFLTRQYKDTLWRTTLRHAFPNAPSRQPEYIFTRVRHLHVLRNRIAHHEPIHRRDIARDFQICIEVLYAISPAIAQWSADNSRVLVMLAQKPM